MSAPEPPLAPRGPLDLVPTGEPPPETRRCICFEVGGEWLALPLRRVREIQPLPRLIRVPNAPAEILGIVNLRGRILTLLALAPALGLPAGDSPTHCMVLDLGPPDPYVGLATHGPGEVAVVPLAQIQPPPGRDEGPAGLEGIFEAGRRIVGLVDLAAIYGRLLGEWGIELQPVADR